MLRNLLSLATLGHVWAQQTTYGGECFVESEKFGFDVRNFQHDVWSDARTLYFRNIMSEETRPDAFRFCLSGRDIKSFQTRVASSSTKDWLNVIGDQDYYKFYDCKVWLAPDNLVTLFVTIGYEAKKGVNFVSLVFSPDYQSEQSEKGVTL